MAEQARTSVKLLSCLAASQGQRQSGAIVPSPTPLLPHAYCLKLHGLRSKVLKRLHRSIAHFIIVIAGMGRHPQ